jgi:hypothetical protein
VKLAGGWANLIPHPMKRLAALALALLPLAQAQQLPSTDVLLDRLYAYAEQYRATLPSLSCEERILSERIGYDGKVRKKARVEGTMREIRKIPLDLQDPFTEQHSFTRVNGRPVRGLVDMPYFIQGGFANLIGFHHSELRECFNYRVTPVADGRTVQIEVDRKDRLADDRCEKIFAGTHYAVVADADGHILHSERTIPAETAEQNDEAYFAAIDYVPQQLGERVFWLPARFESHDATGTGTMEADYSKCHRFGSEVKILPGVTEAGPEIKPR